MKLSTKTLPHHELTERIIAAGYQVQKELGVGFLEVVYQRALCMVLHSNGHKVDVEVPLKVHFRGEVIGNYAADLIVDDTVLVELKSCSELIGRHQAQVINYLTITKLEVGLLLNFGQRPLGLRRLYPRK